MKSAQVSTLKPLPVQPVQDMPCMQHLCRLVPNKGSESGGRHAGNNLVPQFVGSGAELVSIPPISIWFMDV